MRALCMPAPTVVVVAAAAAAAVVCLEANLAHTAEQGVDSQGPLDYLNSMHSLFSIDIWFDNGK